MLLFTLKISVDKMPISTNNTMRVFLPEKTNRTPLKMTDTEFIIIGKFLAGHDEIPELWSFKMTEETCQEMVQLIGIMRGTSDLNNPTLRQIVLTSISFFFH
jgi:hypothetical protein